MLGHPLELTRAAGQRYAAELIAGSKEASTARLRLAALRQYARWLVDEGELDTDPLLGLRAPKLSTKVLRAPTDDQLAAHQLGARAFGTAGTRPSSG